jgi:hypothetical protein
LTSRKARGGAAARLRLRAGRGAEENELSSHFSLHAVLADLVALACAATVFVAAAFEAPTADTTGAAVPAQTAPR